MITRFRLLVNMPLDRFPLRLEFCYGVRTNGGASRGELTHEIKSALDPHELVRSRFADHSLGAHAHIVYLRKLNEAHFLRVSVLLPPFAPRDIEPDYFTG